MTRSQAKISSEEDRNKEAEMEQTEEITHFEIYEDILPQGDEECKKIKKLIEVDSKEFIESQRQRGDLAPLLRKKTIQIKSSHDSASGHLGIVKTKDRIARYFYWSNCYKEIEEYFQTCDPCQRVGESKDETKAPLTLVPVISEVFSKINFDACGPLPTTPNGNRYLITAICLASNYPDAVPIPNIGSTSIIEVMTQIFSRMDFPKEIQTDEGTSFMSNLAVEFAEKFGINVTRSSVHHPQSIPVERFHRGIKRILKVLCTEAAPEWEKQVPAALFALRTIRHESTGFTPSELVYGRNLRTPVTLLYEQWINSEDEGNKVVEYIFQLIILLKRCKELALDKMLEMQTKRKVWYDRKAIKRKFSEGDLVLVITTVKPNKLAVEWKGPGKIEEKLSETHYVVNFEGKERP
ncbi:Retrovirus-related Pol polyprotein from transposon 412 [Araneus ventricosus]|uniref:RNA-directed DNA polymerase n=1 Tax=Araneus ventricosus TaxID=182803 RepID=A0A4Y2CWU6_ARAVE|nr:Retrovirus-related Pol polyprotein from transposon 412 [Araneus ventricosus]